MATLRFSDQNIQSFYDAIKNDDWTEVPQEPMYEHLTQYIKDGFIVSIFNANAVNGESIAAWGPDQLALEVPMPYDFEQMKKNLRRCDFCEKTDVDTQRVFFAGRCCADCLPGMRKNLERPGWTN